MRIQLAPQVVPNDSRTQGPAGPVISYLFRLDLVFSVASISGYIGSIHMQFRKVPWLLIILYTIFSDFFYTINLNQILKKYHCFPAFYTYTSCASSLPVRTQPSNFCAAATLSDSKKKI